MGFYPELAPLTLNELIERFFGPPIEGPAYSRVFYQEVAFLIAAKGRHGRLFLLGMLESHDEDHLCAAIRFLPQPQNAGLRRVVKAKLGTYLADSRALVVMDAIDTLARYKERTALQDILALQHHTSPYVRGGVLRYLSRVFPRKATPMLLEALADPHPIVRANAVDEIDDLALAVAIPMLTPLLNDPDPAVVQATKTAIANLKSA